MNLKQRCKQQQKKPIHFISFPENKYLLFLKWIGLFDMNFTFLLNYVYMHHMVQIVVAAVVAVALAEVWLWAEGLTCMDTLL